MTELPPPTFSALGLPPALVATVTDLGYEEPTPIQAAAIPAMASGRDVLGRAATGTGKTAAFALPVLARLGDSPREVVEPMAMVLVPTRELAIQVSEAMHRYGRRSGARVLPVYGGQPIGRQLRELARGIDVVVATPGRALDHLERGSLRLDAIEVVVLDEADEMLDMGFADDIEALLSSAPEQRQTVLFSATLPARLGSIARRHLREPVSIEIAQVSTTAAGAPLVRQVAYVVGRVHKAAALGRILDVEAPGAALVFCRTRTEVDELTETLNGRGYRAEALHGGMDQTQRDRVMGRLRSGVAELLIATDVAARGLDVDVLTHVVNFDVPSAPEAYVHRIGRVGRAGREGTAITLVDPREHRLLKNLERASGRPIAVEKVPTVADLRVRRLELTRAAVREAVLAGGLDHLQVIVDALAEEFDIVEIALGALRIAHEATVGPDAGADEEIPEPFVRKAREAGPADRSERGGSSGREGGYDGGRAERPGRPAGRAAAEGMTRLFIGLGREAGIRPQDLVGAIAGESGLRGNQIGAIQVTDRFSLVEVPAREADAVIRALRGAMIRGRKATVRHDRETGGPDRGASSRGPIRARRHR
ncbi:MAG: DEAD/DEAH box helicase [Acidimicrobiales bacterium]